MFPAEMTQWPQWVCWNYGVTDGHQTKLPLNPKTGNLASVTDRRHWCDYDIAVQSAKQMGWAGVGFVLTDNDPYCFIDLDDPQGDTDLIRRQESIANAMDSYSELSPSKRGLHVIVKAKVIGGRRRGKIEIYSSHRYMTMTGETWHDKPIKENQYFVDLLWKELDDRSVTPVIVTDLSERYNDETIFNTASSAANGEKFLALWNGNWQPHYATQSEADFALVNIIGFYSRNVAQIKRLFLLSALGKRDKAKRKDYVDKMVQRSFDNQPPMIDLEVAITKLANDLAAKDTGKDKIEASNPFQGPLFANVPDLQYDWTCPPGLMGDIAKFIYDAAPRPVKEVALAAAIGLMAGICGRAYNVSGTGLNQYVLVLARTGVGKEAAAGGIDRLIQAVRNTVPAVTEFIGPADIASGQALIKYLDKHPCFVSIVGEFGLALQQMCSSNASGPQVSLRKNLLALFNKSGATDSYQPMIYSDKEKNTHAIKSPAFTILGESTPETFYESLDEAMIASGLFPRFTCIEYLGPRPSLNHNHISMMPTTELVTHLGELAANCLVMAQHGRTIEVMFDVEAQKYADDFNIKCDTMINNSENDVQRQLWNRGHIRALKLAALIAIGTNPYKPVVDLSSIQWSVSLVDRDITNVLNKFDMGKIGRETGELNQQHELIRVLSDFVRRPYVGVEKYQVPQDMHRDRVVPYGYIQKRLLANAAFKQDRYGATNALKRAVESLANDGMLAEIRGLDVMARYGKQMKAYVILDVARL